MKLVKVTWEKVIDRHSPKPLVVPINLGNGTQFNLVAFFHHSKLFIALERVGSFFFDTQRSKAGEYVSEKLWIPIADANIIADWINVQTNIDHPYQGEYYAEYVKEDQSELFYMGRAITLSPTIKE